MKLTERPRERGLAPVVGSTDDQDPLWPVDLDVVAHHGRALSGQLDRQGQIERLGGVLLLGDNRDGRMRERQTE